MLSKFLTFGEVSLVGLVNLHVILGFSTPAERVRISLIEDFQ